MLFSYFWFAGRFCCRINIVVRLRATLTVAKTMRLYNIHSILKATKTIRISQIVDSLTRYVHLSYVSSEYALSSADKIISAAIVCSLKCFIRNTLTRQRASYWLYDCEFAKKTNDETVSATRTKFKCVILLTLISSSKLANERPKLMSITQVYKNKPTDNSNHNSCKCLPTNAGFERYQAVARLLYHHLLRRNRRKTMALY